MIKSNRGRVTRIDEALDQKIKEVAKKNNLSFREASREMAKAFDLDGVKGKIIREIKF